MNFNESVVNTSKQKLRGNPNSKFNRKFFRNAKTNTEFNECQNSEKMSPHNLKLLSDEDLLDYIRAVNYINYCHSIIDEMISKRTAVTLNEKFKFSSNQNMPDLSDFWNNFRTFMNEKYCHNYNKEKASKVNINQEEIEFCVDRQKNTSGEMVESVTANKHKQTAKEQKPRKKGKKIFIELVPDIKESQEFKKMEFVSKTMTVLDNGNDADNEFSQTDYLEDNSTEGTHIPNDVCQNLRGQNFANGEQFPQEVLRIEEPIFPSGSKSKININDNTIDKVFNNNQKNRTDKMCGDIIGESRCVLSEDDVNKYATELLGFHEFSSEISSNSSVYSCEADVDRCSCNCSQNCCRKTNYTEKIPASLMHEQEALQPHLNELKETTLKLNEFVNNVYTEYKNLSINRGVIGKAIKTANLFGPRRTKKNPINGNCYSNEFTEHQTQDARNLPKAVSLEPMISFAKLRNKIPCPTTKLRDRTSVQNLPGYPFYPQHDRPRKQNSLPSQLNLHNIEQQPFGAYLSNQQNSNGNDLVPHKTIQQRSEGRDDETNVSYLQENKHTFRKNPSKQSLMDVELTTHFSNDKVSSDDDDIMDDILTDSDIDEDICNDLKIRMSSNIPILKQRHMRSNTHLSVDLNRKHKNLLQNQNMEPSKPTGRNKIFRQQRRKSAENCAETLVLTETAYQLRESHSLCRTISRRSMGSDSSDIKSDDEDTVLINNFTKHTY